MDSRMILLVLLAPALAGCAAVETPAEGTSPTATAPTAGTPPATVTPPRVGGATYTLRGVVVDEEIRPIAGATVRVVGPEVTATTREDGSFRFASIPTGATRLQAYAPGYLVANLTVEATTEQVRIVLKAGASATGYPLTYRFEGFIECALEVLIISPSCDSVVGYVAPGNETFEQNFTFPFRADLGWSAMVIDVVFDGDQHPGLAGLRIALRGMEEETPGGEYEQFGRWYGPATFQVQVVPGETYNDGVGPVPGNYTGFRLDAYPHSHAYHALCDTNGRCFLGAGAGHNVRFEVFVTVFHGMPVPEGYTMAA